MAESPNESHRLTDKHMVEAIRVRQEYEIVKTEYCRYRSIRRLMGKTKKDVMDFEELRENALSLTQKGYR